MAREAADTPSAKFVGTHRSAHTGLNLADQLCSSFGPRFNPWAERAAWYAHPSPDLPDEPDSPTPERD